jgi:putative transposase
MQLRYSFRLDPTPGQIRDLARAFGCARWVYNQALAARKASYEAGEGWIPGSVLSKRLITEAKKDPGTAWLGQVSAVVLQQALRDCDVAFKNFFDSATGRRKGPKIGEPRFRSRRENRQAVRFTANSRFKVTDTGRLSLPKIGEVKVRWSRPLVSEPSSVSVIRDASGRYFASFVVVTDPDEDAERFSCAEAETGLDLGLTHFAVLSDGKKIDAPKFLRRAERKLKRLQQDLSRKQKGSNNRCRAAVKVAKAHAHVADSRRDFHHKLSTQIIAENQGVYVEDLAVNGLGRTRLAKSVHDAGWSSFVGMLEYKAARYGRAFAKVDRWTPTSQVCSTCGVSDGKKPLHVREWRCTGCGTLHDRDENAAVNIRNLGRQVAAGRAETLNACGAQVRPGLVPAPRGEAGTRRSDRELNVTGAVGTPVLEDGEDVKLAP